MVYSIPDNIKGCRKDGKNVVFIECYQLPLVIYHDARRGHPDAAIGLAPARTD